MKRLNACYLNDRGGPGVVAAVFAILVLVFAAPVMGQERQVLRGHVPSVTAKLQPLSRLPATNQMRLAIGLPLRNTAELNTLLQGIYDPTSPNYHHYLTPQQFADRFCATKDDYKFLTAFATSNHLAVADVHPNRMLLDVVGSTADIENAFQIKMQLYQHPTENRTFYAPDSNPSVPSGLQVTDISGLNNYRLPHPCIKPSPAGATPQLGAGPGGTYIGDDFRNAYVPNVTLTGAGQKAGLFQFDSYFASDITAYELLTGRPNVPLLNVLLDGYNGIPGFNADEVSLDIEMVISMAPGISEIIVYSAGPFGIANDILNRMATDDLAQQLSASWTWGGGPQTTTDQIFKQMAAQGQTYFNASGDGDAYLDGQMDDLSYGLAPVSNPDITVVGGTTLSTPGPGGPWQSETVWNWGYLPPGWPGTDNGYWGSSGGISSFYTIPSYQQGISMTANLGSTTFRNLPDVALTADNIYVIYDDGLSGSFGGTSCAAPLWNGFTALVNQQAAAVGTAPVGFLNPAVYAIGQGPNYTNCFHDTVTGNNIWSGSGGMFPAVPGYDLCTGWGTPNGANLINALAPNIQAPNLVVLTNIISGGNGNGIVDFNECNDLDLVLTNSGTTNATQVKVSISTVTPGVVIAQSSASYPPIATNGTATNLTPFEISTTPTFICGTPIVLNLLVQSAQITTVVTYVLPTGAQLPPTQITSSSIVGIGGVNGATNSSVIAVAGLDSILDSVTVSVNILYSNISDLTLQLVGPDGTSVTLSQTNGGIGANYGVDCTSETTFDDNGPSLIDTGTAPFLGTYKPDQPLSAFAGKTGSQLNGNWQLVILDGNNIRSGALQCWTLNLTSATCTNGGGQCPGVDLGLGITAQPDPVTVGSNLIYTITVTNSGPNNATGVGVGQSLPAGAIFVQGSASQGTVNASGTSVNCALGELDTGASATVTVVAVPNQTGIASSTVTVSCLETNLNPVNSATAAVLVNPALADLVLGMTASSPTVPLGGIITYTIAVTNRGPVTAQNVVVTNVLPSTATIVTANSSQGTPSSESGEVLVSLGSLTRGSFAIVTVQARVLAVGSITTTASVGGSTIDPIPGNNSATVTTAVTPASDLNFSMTGSPLSAIVGTNITYTLNLQNLGPSPAPNVSVVDVLPANVTFGSATNSAGTANVSGGIVTATITNLGVNSNATITIVINTSPLISEVPITISNVATVSFAGTDLASSTASVSTRVDYAHAVIVPAGSILAGGNYYPSNGFISPGETVTNYFRLQNIGNLNTTNLVATLLGTGGVVLTNGPQVQSYGILQAGGAGALEPFSFAANTTNGGTITATLQLQDGSANLGTASFTYTLPTVSTFSNTNNIVISDHGEAAPYPSMINVSGVTGLISKVTVTMTNVNHTYPDGIGLLLVGPAGQSTLLMSHCGGDGSISNVSLTFDDSATNYLPITPQIPVGVQIVSGTFKPTQNGTVTFPTTNTASPPPAAPWGTNLFGSFDGTNANGNWSLYVYDNEGADSGVIVGGWSLSIAAGTPVNDIVDLGVSGAATPNPVLAGNQLTYTFTVTNNGPNAANLVAFTNVLPANAIFVSASSSQGFCSTNGDAVYCTVSNLAIGSSINVTEVLMPTLPGFITNTATVTSADSDLNQANNTASVITTVTAPTADVAATMSASGAAVVGVNSLFTVTITNSGPGTAFNVVLTNTLGGVAFVSASSPVITNISGLVVCSLGNMAPQTGQTVVFTVVPPVPGFYTNVATVSTASSDPNLSNNVASLVLNAANPAPDILPVRAVLPSTGLTYSNGAINPGETVTVSFILTNSGTASTSNLVATLLATNGVTPQSGSQSYGILRPGGPVGSNTFTFSAAGANGGGFSAVLALQDGASNLGTASFTFSFPATNTFGGAGGILRYGSTPYPSQISVSGLTGVVSKVTVTLSNLSHSFPSDLEMLLVGPGGQDTVLMATAGGAYAVTNVTVTFDDGAASTLPRNAQIVSGTNRPSDFAIALPFPAPAPAQPYSSALEVFDGTSANGIWDLYVLDDSSADSGSFGGWSVNIVTVNPVNSAADVGVTMTAPAGLLFTNENFSYTVNVTNSGPAAATDVILSETFPTTLSFVSTSQPGYASQSGSLTFNLGTLAAGSNISLTITFNAAQPGIYSVAANVSADQADLNLANNTVQIPSTVITPAPAQLKATALTNGAFKLSVTGLPGQYILQGSPDLTNWTSISTNTVPDLGVLQLNDPFAGSFQRRYYRVIFLVP